MASECILPTYLNIGSAISLDEYRLYSDTKMFIIQSFLSGLMELHQSTSILSQRAPDHMDKVCASTTFVHLCRIWFKKNKTLKHSLLTLFSTNHLRGNKNNTWNQSYFYNYSCLFLKTCSPHCNEHIKASKSRRTLTNKISF